MARSKNLALAVVAALVGLAAAGLWRRVWLKPRREADSRRYATARDVLTLYGLEMRYFRLHGAYADGLDALLSAAPDPAAVRARLARDLDLSTLAVIGGSKGFKIEANALDGRRTLVKIKGPIADVSAPRKAEAPVLRVDAAAAELDAGTPVRR